MGIFTFPGDQEHRKFNYRPIYYDKDEEERRQLFGAVDGRLDKESQEKKEKGAYQPGTYIRGSLRNGNYARRSKTSGSQRIIGLISLILLAVMLVFFAKYFVLLMQ
ncbi:MAG: hypothetical protein MJY84_02660 [Bacteroidales bacterium]|nr:hypothetical protein [Bacteroidales bacterium]